MAKMLTFKSSRTPMQNSIIGFSTFVFLILLLGVIPTQWFAWKHHYAANLGEELFRMGGILVYMPTDWVIWGFDYADVPSLKDQVHILTMIGYATIIIAGLTSILLSIFLHRSNKGMENLHGSARWSERADLRNMGFIAGTNYKPTGVIIGSVVYDRKGKIMTPHHPKYNQRYKAELRKGSLFKFWQEPEFVRDGEGRVKYKLNKRVTSKIELLRDGTNTHLFAFAPTRSGKGVGLLLPTFLTWQHSLMANDPKGELYALTSGFRKRAGNVIIKFEPGSSDGSSAAWNPLDEIRIFTEKDVSDAQMIMSIACDPKGEGLNDYFDKAGYEFLMGVCLHVVYSGDNGSLAGVAQFLGDPNWDSDQQMYTYMMGFEHDPECKMNWKDAMGNVTKTHPIIANVAKTMMNKEDKDRSGVLSTAKSLLSLYLDPVISRNTRHSDFLMRDIMTNDKPVSLYLVIQPNDMDRMIPLQRLFYAMFIRRNAADMKFVDGKFEKTYNHSLLMALDEMASLRKLPIIQEALSYVAGYGIRMLMLVQDIAQIEELYTDKQSIDSGAATRIAYGPNKIDTAQKLSEMAGKTTVLEEKTSISKDIGGFKAGNASISFEKTQRDLITSDEFMSLHDNDMVIFRKGQPPTYGRISFFYENPEMVMRTKIPPPAKSDVLRKRKDVEPANSLASAILKTDTSNTDSESNDLKAGWVDSRNEMRDRLNAMLSQDPPLHTNSNAQQNKPDAKYTAASSSTPIQPARKNRYLNKEIVLSEDERKSIIDSAADLSLYERVIALNTFE